MNLCLCTTTPGHLEWKCLCSCHPERRAAGARKAAATKRAMNAASLAALRPDRKSGAKR